MSELKPCPFCGSKGDGGIVNVGVAEYYGQAKYQVFCDGSLGGCGAAGRYDDTEELATAAWNRRPAPEPGTAPMGRDADWVLAMAGALGPDSGYNVPILPRPEAFRDLFDEIRNRATPPPFSARDAWRAAITVANNLCVQSSDRLDNDDGSLDAIHMATDCAKQIRAWLEPSDEQLSEMLAESTGRNPATKGEKFMTKVPDQDLIALREMAATVAVKGKLLIQLLDEIEEGRRSSNEPLSESLSGGNPGETSEGLHSDHRGITQARSSEGGIGGTYAVESIQSCEPVGDNPASDSPGERGALDTRSALTPGGSLSPPPRTARSVTLTGYQLQEALDFIAPDRTPDELETEASIQYGDGHSGVAYYCCLAEYPEEGSLVLDERPAQTKPAALGVDLAKPGTDRTSYYCVPCCREVPSEHASNCPHSTLGEGVDAP